MNYLFQRGSLHYEIIGSQLRFRTKLQFHTPLRGLALIDEGMGNIRPSLIIIVDHLLSAGA